MKNLFTILFVLLACTTIKAQDGVERIYPTNEISTVYPSCVAVDDSGYIWTTYGSKTAARQFPANSGGVARYDPVRRYWWTYDNPTIGKFPDDRAFAIAHDKENTWIGCTKGVVKFDRKNNKMILVDSFHKLPSDTVLSLAFHAGKLWIGTTAGAAVYDGTSITAYPSSLWGSGRTRIYSIAGDSRNRIWFGTDNGLVRFDQGQWTLLNSSTTVSALSSNVIYALRADSKDNLWILADVDRQGGALFRMDQKSTQPLSDLTACFEPVYTRTISAFDINEKNEVQFVSAMNKTWGGNGGVLKFDGTAVIPYKMNPSLQFYMAECAMTLSASGSVIISSKDGLLLVDLDQKIQPVLSYSELGINKVAVGINSNGIIGTNWHAGGSRYEVPNGSCKNPVFTASPWVGGFDGGRNLRLAAMTYLQNGADFFPGTLDTITGKYDSDGNSQLSLDKVWRVSKRTVDDFIIEFAKGNVQNNTYAVPEEITSWPGNGKGNSARQLAPYVDVNNDGVYKPLDGDYPKVKGDEMTFWIVNDNKNIHSESGGIPLGIEMHCIAYAYNCDAIADNEISAALNHTIFYSYKIFNRSNFDYWDVRVGMFVDGDLGNSWDDYSGCDTFGNYGFFYNGDNDDDGRKGYGENPPMFNVLLLNNKMTSFINYENRQGPTGNPNSADHYYNLMNASWNDGTPVTKGGKGYKTGAPTRWMFSGNPYDSTEWNESSAGNLYRDQRFVISTSIDKLKEKTSIDVDLAFVFTWKKDAPNGLTTSWDFNKKSIQKVQEWYDAQKFPSCMPAASVSDVKEISQAGFYPNPSSGSGTLVFHSKSKGRSTIGVTDISGRVVYSVDVDILVGENKLDIDLGQYSSGVYFVNINTPEVQSRVKIVLNK